MRPRPVPLVSAPITWQELERGIKREAFRIENMAARIREVGDLWRPMLASRNERFQLDRVL